MIEMTLVGLLQELNLSRNKIANTVIERKHAEEVPCPLTRL